MQLYALDDSQKLVFARHAVKQKNYFCIECKSSVRRRSGSHRQDHYYHLASQHSCRLNGKSMTHLQIQYHILNLLPEGKGILEFRFPEVNRIADVAWLEKKIIFEVQCSPISDVEVMERNRDYESMGFQVVWILHDQRYNQHRISSAEQWLLDFPHYFTNIDEEGNGSIYDQFSMINRGVRKTKLSPLSINIDCFQKPERKEYCLKIAEKRSKTWPLFFKGDLLDLSNDDQSDYIAQAKALENSITVPNEKKLSG